MFADHHFNYLWLCLAQPSILVPHFFFWDIKLEFMALGGYAEAILLR